DRTVTGVQTCALPISEARSMLDAAGLPQVRIFASRGLDELGIEDLVAAGAPIDAFGVGTLAGVSADAPFLDTVYKLVSYAGRPRSEERRRGKGWSTPR